MSVYYRYISSPSVPNPPGLLDLYPSDTAIGLSYRRLRRDAILCCRILRSTDDVEMDFGFVYDEESGEFIVDMPGILNFVGGATGSITRWYDQNYDPILRYSNYDATPGYNFFSGYLSINRADGVTTTPRQLVVNGVPQYTANGRIGHFTTGTISIGSWGPEGPTLFSTNRGYISTFCVGQPTFVSGMEHCMIRMHPSAPITRRSTFVSRVYHSAAYNNWNTTHESHRTLTTSAVGANVYGASSIPRGSQTALSFQTNAWTDYNATLVENAGVAKRGVSLSAGEEGTNNFHTAKGLSLNAGFQPGDFGGASGNIQFNGIYNECIAYNTNEQHVNRQAINLNQLAFYGIPLPVAA